MPIGSELLAVMSRCYRTVSCQITQLTGSARHIPGGRHAEEMFAFRTQGNSGTGPGGSHDFYSDGLHHLCESCHPELCRRARAHRLGARLCSYAGRYLPGGWGHDGAHGLVTNYPLAMASGMGFNAVVAFQLVAGLKLPWPAAMGVITLEGIIITVLVLTGFRMRDRRRPWHSSVLLAWALGCSSCLLACTREGW